MLYKREWILAATFLILASCLLFFPRLEGESKPDRAGLEDIRIVVQGKTEENQIKLWKREDGVWFGFLPSGTQMDSVRLQAQDGLKVWVNGTSAEEGAGKIVPGEENRIELRDQGGKAVEEGTVVFLASSQLPSIHITTKSGSMEHIRSSQENEESGYLSIFSASGDTLYRGTADRIKGRGNTSWEAPKQSFSVKLDTGASLLGMDSSRSWILSANYYDGAYIRNRIGQEIGRKAGLSYSPEGVFADLYLNGEYWGIYELTEKIQMTEGFLFEIDYPERAAEEENVLFLRNDQPVVVHHPGTLTSDQQKALQQWYQEMLAALYAQDYINPQTGKDIFEYLDLESFAARYLVEELFMDMDMGVTSHYMYMKEGTGILFQGPMWDLDNTLGRAQYDRNIFYANQKDLGTNQMSRCYARLCGNAVFYQEVLEQWERLKPFLVELSEKGIDGTIDPLYDSIEMDLVRWPGERSAYMSQLDMETNIRFLKQYLSDRTAFLDQAFVSQPEKTWELFGEQSVGLPQLERIEAPEAEATQQEEGAGWVAMHGEAFFGILLFLLVCLVCMDRYRNRRGRA